MNDEQLEKINFAKNLHENPSGGIDYWTPLKDISPVGLLTANHLAKVTPNLQDVEYKILASYALLQSTLCSVVPIVQLLGEPGSGKSQLLLAIAELTQQTLFVGGSTGASIKNHINKMRWIDPGSMSYEKNCILLCDNVNQSTFEQEGTLTAFLNGYNRKTDRQYISNGKGENIEFRTFCPKAFSSIWQIESRELQRRCLIIKTRKLPKNSDIPIVEIDDINWTIPRNAINDFWSHSITWETFVRFKQLISKTHKPRHAKEYWILLKDLIATGLTTEVWSDVNEAIEELAAWLDTALRPRVQILDSVVMEAIEIYCGQPRDKWNELALIIDLVVPPKHIKQAVDTAIANGLIERPKLATIQECLIKLRFKPGKDSSGVIYRYHKE